MKGTEKVEMPDVMRYLHDIEKARLKNSQSLNGLLEHVRDMYVGKFISFNVDQWIKVESVVSIGEQYTNIYDDKPVHGMEVEGEILINRAYCPDNFHETYLHGCQVVVKPGKTVIEINPDGSFHNRKMTVSDTHALHTVKIDCFPDKMYERWKKSYEESLDMDGNPIMANTNVAFIKDGRIIIGRPKTYNSDRMYEIVYVKAFKSYTVKLKGCQIKRV